MRMTSLRIPGLLLAALLALAGCNREAPPQDASPATTEYMRPVGELAEADAMLFRAAGMGDVDAIEEALDLGANINATDGIKRTALFGAAFLNRAEAVKLLIERGGRLDIDDQNGFAPLHAAVVGGGKEAAATLIALGADINERTLGGRTSLHLAAATNQPAMVGLLLEKGANPRAKDSEGLTPAAIAVRNGHAAVGDRIKHWVETHRADARR